MKSKKQYVCGSCGARYAGWQGKCDSCGDWNTIIEQSVIKNVTKIIRENSHSIIAKPYILGDISREDAAKISTNFVEFDRVLGGGITKGGVYLLTGEPGIGKSTLLLQIAMHMSMKGTSVLYVSAEEPIQQVALRYDRILSKGDIVGEKEQIENNLRLANAYNLTDIESIIAEMGGGGLVIIDSIQTIVDTDSVGLPGGQAQIRANASKLTTLAKEIGFSLMIVGHVTKEGSLAGPKLLEHLVDVVLFFEGEEKGGLRLLRAQKNRYGSTAELGVMLLDDSGLRSVAELQEFFLNSGKGKAEPQIGAVRTIVMEGNRPIIIEVQALAVPTAFAYPKKVAEGIPLTRVQLIAAIMSRYLGLKLDGYDIYVNLPHGYRTADRGIDLAVAVAIYSSVKKVKVPAGQLFIGELVLSGRVVNPVQSERRASEAKNMGYKDVVTVKRNGANDLKSLLKGLF